MTDQNREVWFLTSELEGERASSFRQERWCRVFLDAGAKLRIFNLRGAFSHSDVVCANVEDLLKFRSEGLSRYRGPQTSVREGFVVRVLRSIKHLMLVDLFLPNIFKLYLELNNLLSKRNEPVVLMASSPPFSVAVVGFFIKCRYPAKVIFAVDMRDAWALHMALGGIKPLKRAIERRVLLGADRVTTVSKGLADEFNHEYGVDVGIMYNVATHYLDVPRPKQILLNEINSEIDPSRIVLVYTGSTPEHFYDVAAIVSAVKRLRSEHPNLAQRLQLVFLGACEEVRREARSQGVSGSDIIFVSHLPHAMARSVQVSADALIFLAYHGPDNMGVVSTKLFEYLCLGKPIIPFDLHEGSDVDLLLHRYCGVSINVHGESEIFAQLITIATEGVKSLPFLDDTNRVRELLEDYRHHAATLLST
jgi:glycosyltransferase involved in cell wall biosynthesis